MGLQPMRRICVLFDAAGRPAAASLCALLRTAGYEVEAVARERYPVGDSLPALLGVLGSRCDCAIAVIGPSEIAQSWVVRELAIESLYPSWLMVLAPEIPRPTWWRADDDRLLGADEDIPARVARLLGRGAPRT
jgi:hypothetical protein